MLTKLITLFRVLALPLIIYFLLQDTVLGALWALVIMIFAIFSDVLDSFLATKRDVRSFFDPFADKFLVIGLLLTFAFLDQFSWFIVGFFFVRDIIIGIIRLLAGREDVHIHGIIYGKLLIISQYLILVALLLQTFLTRQHGPLPSLDVVVSIAVAISIFIAALSLVHYPFSYWRALFSAKRKGRTVKKDALVVIANRKSRGYQSPYRRRLLRIFSRRRKAQITYFPRSKNMFNGIEQKVRGINHLIIAGGDGSYESALNYKPFWKKSLGFFPFGAGNAFYSYFYKGKKFEYLRERFHFQEQELDVLEIAWDHGTRQTMFLGIGLDGEVMKRSAPRTKWGFMDYMKGGWKTFLHAKGSYNITCTVDGKRHEWNNVLNMIFGKIAFYGYGIRWTARKIHGHDGMVYGNACINTHSKFLNKWLRIWALLVPMFGYSRPPLYPLRGKKIVLESGKAFPFHAGGEYLGYTKKLVIKVVRKQKVLMI